MDTRYRPWLTEPGEPLLHASGLTDIASRFSDFCDSTGVDPSRVYSALTVAVPLPVAPPAWGPGLRRWPGTLPTAMWHPLMWLPPRLLGRYELEGPDGSVDVESDEAWSVRVALECTAAGMYDESSGMWLDVLSTAGLDIDDPAVVDRVKVWLGGGADDVLDRIDLSSDFDQDDTHWAVDVVSGGLLDQLLVIARAVTASSLLEVIDDDLLPLATVVRYAADTFDGDSATDDAWWRAASDDPRVDEQVDEVVSRLRQIRDMYWPELERLAAEGSDLVRQAGIDQSPEPQFSWA